MAVFSEQMVPEVVQPFWAAMQGGEFITDAAARAGTFARRVPGGWRPPLGFARVEAGTWPGGTCRSLSGRRSR